MKPKIFIIGVACDMFSGGIQGCALAEDGTVLAGHISSSRRFFRHDMGLIGTFEDPQGWKHDHYREHYPNGYELVEVPEDEVESHHGYLAALERNKANAVTQ